MVQRLWNGAASVDGTTIIMIYQVKNNNELDFKTNWNGKLNCKMFTTLRLHNPKKYYAGARLVVTLKGERVKTVRVLAVRIRRLHELEDFECYLDTGGDAIYTRNIITGFYKNKPGFDVSSARFDIIMCETIEVYKKAEQLGFEFE